MIVYDDAHGDTQEAQRIIKGQQALIDKDNEVDFAVIRFRIDENSYASLAACANAIRQEVKNPHDIYLNATDGLSSVALVLATHLMPDGAKVIAYDRYANTYNLHTSQTMQRYPVTETLDIRTHLLTKGYDVISFQDKHTLDRRKKTIFALAKDLTRYKHFADHVGQVGLDNVEGYSDYKVLLERIECADQKFIQGTVFEEYVYHLIRDNLDFDDVCTGVKVRFEEGVENEFDILLIIDNHLHTIECKLVSGLDGEHYVYKTERVKEYLDDDGRAMILSIGADNVRITKSGRKRVQFTRGDRARADFGDIKVHQRRVFDPEAFLNDVREWFIV